MLYVLTGGIQTGKTRWLERLVCEFESCGVPCFGVISPGIWHDTRTEDGGISYEKLGIESLLLPEKTRHLFARRRDVAEHEGLIDARWQSSRAELGWAISDEALKSVNGHFDALEALASTVDLRDQASKTSQASQEQSQAGMLIIDELGRLELEKGGGLTSAVRLLERGPTTLYQHALIIARDWLANKARSRFSNAWQRAQTISPTEQAREQIAAALGITLRP